MNFFQKRIFTKWILGVFYWEPQDAKSWSEYSLTGVAILKNLPKLNIPLN